MSEAIRNLGKPTATTGGAGLIVNGVLAYFFYVYAFRNPDPISCFAKEGNKTAYDEIPTVTTSGALRGSLMKGFSDVQIQFMSWFYFSFALSVLGLLQSILVVIFHFSSNETIQTLTTWLCGINCLALLV